MIAEESHKLFYKNNVLQSIFPVESFFGYTVWSYMIPPFKPKNVLILGYGYGTLAGLIKKFWGYDIWIKGVDLDSNASFNAKDKFFVKDAFEFTKHCNEKFDFVAIDLFDGRNQPDFIFSEEFVFQLKSICSKMMCINIWKENIKKLEHYYKYFHSPFEKGLRENGVVFFEIGESNIKQTLERLEKGNIDVR